MNTALQLLLPQQFKELFMPTVTTPKHKDGDFFVDYEEKVFEDV